MIGGIVQSKSKTFLTFCFCFLFGIAGASFWNQKIDGVIIYIALLSVIGLLVIFYKSTKIRFGVAFTLILVLGFGRYQVAMPPAVELSDGQAWIHGFVVAEPDIRQDGIRYIIKSKEQRIYFKSDLYPRYEYGDELSVLCRLKRPEPIEDFRYDMYLARFGVFTTCQATSVTLVATNQGNPVLIQIFSLKKWFAHKINEMWHEPYAGFMSGLLYGYRGGLGSLNNHFSRTGVTHIIAISGYNITLISTIMITFFTHLHIPRKKAFYFIVAGIILFVIFAGASASVVRAGIMGCIVLVAKQMGRASSILNVLMMTAVLMSLHNPYVLIWDAGFQLSFLSTVGLVYVSPLIEKYFTWIPNSMELQSSFVATMSATIVTLPLILYQFGRLSIVALPVNVLILFAIPYIMAVGFFAVMASAVPGLGQVLAWIAWFGMKYIVLTVTFFSSLWFASVDMRIPLFAVVISYVLILAFIIKKS